MQPAHLRVRGRWLLVSLLALGGLTDGRLVRPARGGTTVLVSVSPDGKQGNKASKRPGISGDGRYVVFDSNAFNLVPGDTNGGTDIFVYDRKTREIILASVGNDGKQAAGAGRYAAISEDGRFVAFHSGDGALVPGDTNGKTDVFVRDLFAQTTTRVSISTEGVEGDKASKFPSLSRDARFVAFESTATNLVPNDTNGVGDIFVHDRKTGKTERVSVGPGGVQANGPSRYPSISGDGRYVQFWSVASNLVPGDTNGVGDIFVHDRKTGKTVRASVGDDGAQANAGNNRASISADGRWVAFYSDADNLVPDDTNGASDVFVRDLKEGRTIRASVADDGAQANDASRRPKISGDGRYVVFWSLATNLVPNDTNGQNDIFVRDLRAGRTYRVSVDSNGRQANGKSGYPAISADGRWVAFQSGATNLVPNDTNGKTDVFLREFRPAESD